MGVVCCLVGGWFLSLWVALVGLGVVAWVFCLISVSLMVLLVMWLIVLITFYFCVLYDLISSLVCYCLVCFVVSVCLVASWVLCVYRSC